MLQAKHTHSTLHSLHRPLLSPSTMAWISLIREIHLECDMTHDGSMVLLYMVLHGSHQYTPVMLAYIPYMDPMGDMICFFLRIVEWIHRNYGIIMEWIARKNHLQLKFMKLAMPLWLGWFLSWSLRSLKLFGLWSGLRHWSCLPHDASKWRCS